MEGEGDRATRSAIVIKLIIDQESNAPVTDRLLRLVIMVPPDIIITK
jgi:hypothetical protein